MHLTSFRSFGASQRVHGSRVSFRLASAPSASVLIPNKKYIALSFGKEAQKGSIYSFSTTVKPLIAQKGSSTSSPKKSGDRIGSLADLVHQDLIKGFPSGKSFSLPDVLTAVWKNQTVTAQCPDLIIRLTSLRGEVMIRFLLFIIYNYRI